MLSEAASHRVFFGVPALLFVLGSGATIVWCARMSATAGMLTPGGWATSMLWIRMPGQTWPGVAAAFLGMWLVTTVAMMPPCLVPMLLRYQRALGGTAEHAGRLTAWVGTGYFFVWTTLGIVVFPRGAGLAAIEMQQPALARVSPLISGALVVIAGALQFSAWKARHLECCRAAPPRCALPTDIDTAWRYGIRLGLHCSSCCANLMAVLLIIGIMDLRAMTVVAAAFAAERLTPAGERIVRAIGVAVMGLGLFRVVTVLST